MHWSRILLQFIHDSCTATPTCFQLIFTVNSSDVRLALHPNKNEQFKMSMFDGGAIALRLLYPDSTVLVDYMELELPDCMSVQNMSHNYQYHVVPAPSSRRLRTNTATHTVRLIPHLRGRWSSDQRVLWLYPRIRCAARGLPVRQACSVTLSVGHMFAAALRSRVTSSTFVHYGHRLTRQPKTTGKS